MDVIERFLKYVSFDTKSDEESATVPSTEKQKLLGAYLVEELRSIGLRDAHMDEYGYVYAWLDATVGCEKLPTLGLIAHMDTSPDVSGANVNARTVRYEGGKLELGNGAFLSPSVFPSSLSLPIWNASGISFARSSNRCSNVVYERRKRQ